jgi:hypothetical protein
VYAKVFATGTFHSACRRWNEIIPADQTWNDFITHFATAYLQHKQMQVETAAASGYANAAIAQPADDDLAGAAIDAFANLAIYTSVDRDIVATLTEDNSRLTDQLEDTSLNVKESGLPSKRSATNAVLESPLRLPKVITVGLMGTRLQEIIPVRTSCI